MTLPRYTPIKDNFKPKAEKKGAVRTYPDGREVCADNVAGRREYKHRTYVAWKRQGGLCRWCEEEVPDPYGPYESGYMESPTLDHDNGRGMGAAHRDDRMVVDGKPQNGCVHHACNLARASQRELTCSEAIAARKRNG